MHNINRAGAVTPAEREDVMTNYQGVRRLKKYLKNEYGVGSRDFGSYERYSGYEKIHFFDSNDVETTMTIRAFADSVWISIDEFDVDWNCLCQVGHCDVLSLDEFHKICNGGKVDEVVVEDSVVVNPDCEEGDEADPDALPFGEMMNDSHADPDSDSGVKLPAPCSFCVYGCKNDDNWNSPKGMYCSYGIGDFDYLIPESGLPCRGDFRI